VTSFSTISNEVVPVQDPGEDLDNSERVIQGKFSIGRKRSEDHLRLLEDSKEKEPIAKWKYREKDREQRFGKG